MSKNHWKGKIPHTGNTDHVFEQFTHFDYGVRALFVLIRNYISMNYNTIEKIIKRYAPETENATRKYIDYVSHSSAVSRESTVYFEDSDTICKICASIVLFENGLHRDYYPYFYNYFKLIVVYA